MDVPHGPMSEGEIRRAVRLSNLITKCSEDMMPFTPDDKKYLSIARAGHRLGKARYAVLNLVAKRELESSTIAERLVVTKASVEAYLRKNPREGTP